MTERCNIVVWRPGEPSLCRHEQCSGRLYDILPSHCSDHRCLLCPILNLEAPLAGDQSGSTAVVVPALGQIHVWSRWFAALPLPADLRRATGFAVLEHTSHRRMAENLRASGLWPWELPGHESEVEPEVYRVGDEPEWWLRTVRARVIEDEQARLAAQYDGQRAWTDRENRREAASESLSELVALPVGILSAPLDERFVDTCSWCHRPSLCRIRSGSAGMQSECEPACAVRDRDKG
jgi:hypothetical protein